MIGNRRVIAKRPGGKLPPPKFSGEPEDANRPELPGFEIIRLHFSVDEEATAKALAQQSQMSPEDWEREHNLKSVGSRGSYPVYSGWRRHLHEDGSIFYDPSWGEIYRGWDFGKIHPAVEFFQADGRLVNGIDEVTDENVDLPEFADKVLLHCQRRYPGATFIDRCDPSGRNEKDTGPSSVRALRKKGINVRFKITEVEEGISIMTRLIMGLDVSGRPFLQINPRRMPHLAKAIRDGYRRNKKGDLIKDGTHDHYPDAARYAIIAISPDTSGAAAIDIHTERARNYRYRPNNSLTGY